jgi:hypothetical protein
MADPAKPQAQRSAAKADVLTMLMEYLLAPEPFLTGVFRSDQEKALGCR